MLSYKSNYEIDSFKRKRQIIVINYLITHIYMMRVIRND